MRWRVARFLLLAAVYYTILVAAWDLVQATYRRPFLTCAEAVFGHFGDGRTVAFVDADADQRQRDRTKRSDVDVMVYPLLPGDTGSRTAFGLSTFRHAYLPTAVLLALLLSTPRVWRHRPWSFALAILAVHAFTLIRLWIAIVFGYSTVAGPDGRMAIALGPVSKAVLFKVATFLWHEPQTTYVGPIAIWGLIYLWRGEPSSLFAHELGQGGRPDAASKANGPTAERL